MNRKLTNGNAYLNKLEVEIMNLMRDNINSIKIPALIGEREGMKSHLYELSNED